jgi:hypothetical protein
MNFSATPQSHLSQPVLPRGMVAQPAARSGAEPSGLTPEEIRKIVLDVLG